jgi:hypothetical protein
VERREKARREIRELVAEFHARLPREQAPDIGAIYVRYSTRFQDSVADQVRALLEMALRERVFVPLEFVFFDLAVRGYKSQRDGLDGLRAVLARKAVTVLLVFGTNRLFRKTYKAMQFVEEEVVEQGIRCIFAKSAIDTADKERWRATLQFNAVLDEMGAGMYADNIRAAQEGLFDRLLVHGTVSFGYDGEPIPGELTRRKLPRRKLVVDPEEARWVRQIFAWFVQDLVRIDEIIRRLNDNPEIPLPPKSANGAWTRQAVRTVLMNPRYRGWWEYGKTQTLWQAKKDYARQVAREEPLRAAQIEELRIVPDDLWYGAQRRLAGLERTSVGRKSKDGERGSRPKLLNGLLWCAEHGRPLYVAGPHGKHMICMSCRGLRAKQRPLYTQLNRALALKLTCARLADVVREDSDLVGRAIDACKREAARAQQTDPARSQELSRREQKLTERIKFVMNNVGESEADQKESAEELRRLRRERADVQAELARLQAAGGRPVKIPSEGEVRGLLTELSAILVSAGEGADEDIGTAREVIKLLTGGRIELYQQGLRQAHRGWLQGRFRVQLLPYLLEQGMGVPGVDLEGQGREVVIDYREPPPCEEESERAKQLYDQGLLHCQIAAALGCGRNWVTKLIRHWFESRGLAVPDGRGRRHTLRRKQIGQTMYEQHADAAKALWDQGLADVQIAARLGCSPPTAVAAVAYWHRSRGQPEPSHAGRKAALIDRMQALYDEGRLIRQIAREVGMCSRSVTLLLRERLRSLGRTMPDGRTSRTSSKQRGQATDSQPVQGGVPRSRKGEELGQP